MPNGIIMMGWFKGIPTMDQNQPKIQVELLFAYPNVAENLVVAHQRSTLR